MNVDTLCSAFEEDFGSVDTVADANFHSTRVTHNDFLLDIEVSDEQVRIHNIAVCPIEKGIGSAVVSIICLWALEEELDVVALNVLPDAENWWVSRGFHRISANNDLYFSIEVEELDEERLADTCLDAL